MDLSLNTSIHPLTVIAGVLAVASLVLVVFFVHDRRQRIPGILLSTGLILLLVAPMLRDAGLAKAITGVATVFVGISVVLNIRTLRASSH